MGPIQTHFVRKYSSRSFLPSQLINGPIVQRYAPPRGDIYLEDPQTSSGYLGDPFLYNAFHGLHSGYCKMPPPSMRQCNPAVSEGGRSDIGFRQTCGKGRTQAREGDATVVCCKGGGRCLRGILWRTILKFDGRMFGA